MPERKAGRLPSSTWRSSEGTRQPIPKTKGDITYHKGLGYM